MVGSESVGVSVTLTRPHRSLEARNKDFGHSHGRVE